MATHAAEPSQPVLLIADADPDAREETVSALVRRFGRDYQVLSAETAQDGLDALERVAGQGGEVALVAADLRLPGMGGVEFLQRARVLHPGASRVLLVADGPVSHAGAVHRAHYAAAGHRPGPD